MSVTVSSLAGAYQVEKLVGETSTHRMYEAVDLESSQELLMFIATEILHNSNLELMSYRLKMMREHALLLEAEYQKQFPDKSLGYQYALPKVHDAFFADKQGGRMVLMLQIEAVDHISSLVPLSMIRNKDQVRVDHKTAAWILGKSLKLLAFAHDFGLVLGDINGDDILIERRSHLVMCVDWTRASKFPQQSTQSLSIVQRELSGIAKEITDLMGGSVNQYLLPDSIPESNDDPERRFESFLRNLSGGLYSSAGDAHKSFYLMVEEMWGRKFHPFTSFPL